MVWANKSRGLKTYGKSKDLYERPFHVQDGSWAMFNGIRIYHSDSTTEEKDVCLSLKKAGVKSLIKALTKALETM